MRILGPPTATLAQVTERAPGGLFRSAMLLPLWSAAYDRGVDPVGVIAQAMKETGNGTYTGQVKPQFYNTCGLKVRHLGMFPEADGDRPLAHQMFPNWRVGAIAHVQHLLAYTGVAINHEPVLDPRYDWVVGKHSAVHFADLGGKWAPSPSYGRELEEIARRLSA
jgi:N-acetylmuramoyl-L-alanine amidase